MCILAKVVRYLQQCKAYGTLIVPYWPSASFWPLIIGGGGFISDVVAHVELPACEQRVLCCW